MRDRGKGEGADDRGDDGTDGGDEADEGEADSERYLAIAGV
jgi:hypothetical protein